MTFALYDVESGGSPLWSETHANVPVAEGLFSVRLGSINALSTESFHNLEDALLQPDATVMDQRWYRAHPSLGTLA
jgi:hypothetical protein